MNIVAFDPSISSTGVWLDEKNRSMTIKTDPKEDRIVRLARILKTVSSIIKEERPSVVVVEGYAMGIKNSSALTVQAEVGGIIRAVAKTLGAYVIEIPPYQWKSAVMGKNMVRAKKKTKMDQALYIGVAQSISRRRFETSDEADAWMLAHYVKEGVKGNMPDTDGLRRMKARLVADCVV